MTTYTVNVARHGDWWSVHADVPGAVVWTQCRRLDQAEPTVREAIALALDVPPGSFEVEVESAIEPRLRAQIDAALALSRLADQAQKASSLMSTQAARTLKDDRMTVGDIGTLLSLSAQRISQLAPGGRDATDPTAAREVEALLDAIAAELSAAKAALRAASGTGGRSRRAAAKEVAG